MGEFIKDSWKHAKMLIIVSLIIVPVVFLVVSLVLNNLVGIVIAAVVAILIDTIIIGLSYRHWIDEWEGEVVEKELCIQVAVMVVVVSLMSFI